MANNKFDKIVKQIKEKQTEVENLSKTLETEQQELSALENLNFQIRLSDLVQSLSAVSGVNVLDMSVSLTTNIWVSDDAEAKSILDANKPFTRLAIHLISKETQDNKKPFTFYIYQPLDFEQIQADGRPLRDHCTVVDIPNASELSEDSKRIDVTESVGEIVCTFNINEIANNNFLAFGCSKELLQEAIIDCYNNYEANMVQE